MQRAVPRSCAPIAEPERQYRRQLAQIVARAEQPKGAQQQHGHIGHDRNHDVAQTDIRFIAGHARRVDCGASEDGATSEIQSVRAATLSADILEKSYNRAKILDRRRCEAATLLKSGA